jgi:hypothetical protein
MHWFGIVFYYLEKSCLWFVCIITGWFSFQCIKESGMKNKITKF